MHLHSIQSVSSRIQEGLGRSAVASQRALLNVAVAKWSSGALTTICSSYKTRNYFIILFLRFDSCEGFMVRELRLRAGKAIISRFLDMGFFRTTKTRKERKTCV